jgi:hypothetical protein
MIYMGVKLGLSYEGNNIGWGVFENGVLWKMCGPKIEQVTGERRRIRNVELRHLCCSPNMRRSGWTGHAARMEGRYVCTGFLQKN